MKNGVFPESVVPAGPYPFLADLKLNAWAIAAVGVAFVTRLLLRTHADWDPWLRSIVALTPMLPMLLYVRSLAGWIRGMDELQRGIQVEACLFATGGTLVVVAAHQLLSVAGVMAGTRLEHGFGWEGLWVLVVLSFIVGNAVVNRRYR